MDKAKKTSALMMFKEQLLASIITSPIIYIPHYHFAYIDEVLKGIFNGNAEKGKDFKLTTEALLEFAQDRGVIDFDTKDPSDGSAVGFKALLKEIVKKRTIKEGERDTRIVKEDHKVFLIKNSHKDLSEGGIQGLLQTFVEIYERGSYESPYTIIFVCNYPVSLLPIEILKLLTVVNLPLPDVIDIENELGLSNREVTQDVLLSKSSYKHNGYVFGQAFMGKNSFEKNRKELVSALLGMQLYDIRKVLKTIQKLEGDINPHYSGRSLEEHILREKRQLVNNSCLLEVIELEQNQKDRIGNIDHLKSFIEKQRKIIDNLVLYPTCLPKPKGVLLVGPPGCGKSETVKSIAAIFEKPLLRLDIGKLMGKYVGESENNLIEAIRIAEAAQPCVLWIDEIEKAFAGFGNNDQGNDITVTRMVGYFLTWMQERKSLVYLVATANDLDSLRPELLRKGRWDEIFYLSYPDMKGAAEILQKCLFKYGLWLGDGNETIIGSDGKIINESKVNALCKKFADSYFSGAEIDSIIVQAFNEDWNLSEENRVKLQTLDKLAETIASNKSSAEKESQNNKIDEVILDMKIGSGKKNLTNEPEIKELLKQKFKMKSPKEIISEYKSKGYISAS